MACSLALQAGKIGKDTDSDSGSANAPGTTDAEGVMGAGHPERTPAPLRDLRKSRVSWLGLDCNQLVARAGAADGITPGARV